MTHRAPARLRDVVVDFETYYDTEYSLRRMSHIEYIKHPMFHVHGCSIKVDGGVSAWVGGSLLKDVFNTVDWSTINMVGHNLSFDGAILEWAYGHSPALYSDTLGMSRFCVGPLIKSHSLASVHEHLTGRPAKLFSSSLNDVKGVRMPTPAQMQALGSYACDDADETWAIYQKMSPMFPDSEVRRLDWTIRMLTSPQLRLDRDTLFNVQQTEVEKKALACDMLGVDIKSLRSNDKFAALLTARGVEPPTKVSPTTGKKTFDFAKSSRNFTDLQHHDDPVVRELVSARLITKTSISETRAATYIRVHDACSGWMPVSLNYCGASQTNRLSAGAGKLNQQNLGRGSDLRKAMVAPKGYVVVAADLSNIELRVNMLNCREWQAVDDLRNGLDLYCKFASTLYQRTITKADPDERFIGKTAELSLGYLAGAGTFRQMLWATAKRDEPAAFCQQVVDLYRGTHTGLMNMSKLLRGALRVMAAGGTPESPYNAPIELHQDGILMPSGFKIKLPDIKRGVNEAGREEFTFIRHGKMWPSGRDRLGVPAMLENPSQALAACVLADMQDRILRDTGVSPAMQVHDEIIFVVREDIADAFKANVLDTMHKPPSWWPELPVAAEAGVGYNYGEAK